MKFTGVSVIIPTIREKESFVKLIDILLETVKLDDIHEFIAVVCEKTDKECFDYINKGKEKAERAGISFTILYQTHPFFGGAMVDGFSAATGSHVVLETPDLNTAPEELCELIELSKEYPGDIISCSRWMKGGGVVNYNPIKKIWNKCSQIVLRVMYDFKVTDYTFGVHIAPTELYQSINFRETKHPINLEEVIIPIRLGVKIHEIPAVSVAEEEDVTVNPLLANINYLRPAFYWRFAKKSEMMKLNKREEKDG